APAGFVFVPFLACHIARIIHGRSRKNQMGRRGAVMFDSTLRDNLRFFAPTSMSVIRQLYGHAPALLTDLYQLTMAYAHWHNGTGEREAVFHLFYRSAP